MKIKVTVIHRIEGGPAIERIVETEVCELTPLDSPKYPKLSPLVCTLIDIFDAIEMVSKNSEAKS